MNFETINIKKEEKENNLLERGRNIFSELLEKHENLNQEEFDELYEESRRILSDLEMKNYRDFIMLLGRAVGVYRKIGKQDIADDLIRLNKRRVSK